MRERKYRPGRVIKSFAQLHAQIIGGQYVYMFDRPCHPSWLGSMQYYNLVNMMRMGAFRFAHRNKAAKDA